MSHTYTAPWKTPWSILDHALDLSRWKDEGETIATVEAETIEGSVTTSNSGPVGDNAVWRVAGGTVGESALVRVRWTMSSGRRDERTILYPIRTR